jgi:uncharacterized protein
LRLLQRVEEAYHAGQVSHVRILWHGGEPLLLGKPFFKAIAARTRLMREYLRQKIQTNLLLLDPGWCSILSQFVMTGGIGTSTDPFHMVRRLPNGDSYHRHWIKSLSLMDEHHLPTGCVYVVHQRSLNKVSELYEYFSKLRHPGLLSLRVNPLLRVGHGASARLDNLALHPGQYGRFLKDMTALWLADDRRFQLQPIKSIVNLWQGRATKKPCDLAGKAGCMDSSLGMDCNGYIYNCGRAVDAAGETFGDVFRDSLEQWLTNRSENRLTQRENSLLDTECGSCSYWSFCHGGCPYESHALGDTWHPTQLCSDYREYFTWLHEALGPPVTDQPFASAARRSPGCPA